ncbi:MAG: pyroglutamyl-peptidase I [Clostridia bacterium]|nr:pyroglutamyl-peptidase I [Clostridia bacterium]
MKILLTAFEPFGGDTVNPAQEAVRLVPDTVAGAEIIKLDVPVVVGKSVAVVREAMERERPDAVLCIGQAGGRIGLTPERVAINIDDARIPDNEGNQPIDQPVFADGAPAYFSNLPVKAMVAAIREAGVPASLSNSAGTFVCNHLMYGVLYHIAKSWPQMLGGFMHVPFLHEQVMNRPNTPSLSTQDIVTGICAALSAIVANEQDAAHVMGEIH